MPVAAPPPPPAPAPDPIVAQIADANLEPEVTAPSRAYVVSLAIGGSFTLGFNVTDAAGEGGGGSLRVSRRMTANRRWYANLEIATGTALHAHAGSTYVNTASGFLVGAQYYVNTAFWIRAGIGVGAYKQQQVLLEDHSTGDRSLPGMAFIGGAGFELVHWRHVGLDLEIRTLSIPDRLGLVASSGVELGVELY